MGNLGITRGEALSSERNADLVIGEKFGRLANRIWLFAHVIAHAIERRAQVWNPCFDEYAGYFRSTEGGIIPRYPALQKKSAGSQGTRSLAYSAFARVVGRLTSRPIESRYYSIVTTGMNDTFDLSRSAFAELEKRKRLVVLAGWRFRDYEAFDKHEGEIRRYFSPSASIDSRVNAIVANARANAGVLIGVHMRAGDYRTFLGGKYYYDAASYRSLMDRAAALFPGRRVRFLICSDEPLDQQIFAGADFTPGSGHPAEDLISFSRCDYIIGPPSTYTMWASFYGRVPLAVVRDPSSELSMDSFRIIDGRFDVDAEVV